MHVKHFSPNAVLQAWGPSESVWTPLESFSNDALAGMLTDVLGPARARDGVAGVAGVVFVVGFAWAVALGLLLVSGAAL